MHSPLCPELQKGQIVFLLETGHLLVFQLAHSTIHLNKVLAPGGNEFGQFLPTNLPPCLGMGKSESHTPEGHSTQRSMSMVFRAELLPVSLLEV